MGISYCVWYKNGLYMSMLESDNRWGPPFLLSDSATGDFSAAIDESDSISTSFVDYSGRLLNIRACEEKREPTVLLESRIAGSYPYNVSMVMLNDLAHVFYTVSHNRKQLLTYQRVEYSGFSMPEVQGVIVKDGKNYGLCTDETDIHVFFITEVQEVNLLVHRKIGADGKAAKPETTAFPYGVSKRIQVVASKDGLIYILASENGGKDPALLFKYDTATGKFSKPLEIFPPTYQQGSDCLAVANGYPLVIRVSKGNIIVARSKTDMSGLLDETKFDLNAKDLPLECRLASNLKEDRYLRCDHIPVLFSNGLRFPFDIKAIVGNSPEKPADEKNRLNDRIKELEGRVEFLEHTIRELLRP